MCIPICSGAFGSSKSSHSALSQCRDKNLLMYRAVLSCLSRRARWTLRLKMMSETAGQRRYSCRSGSTFESVKPHAAYRQGRLDTLTWTPFVSKKDKVLDQSASANISALSFPLKKKHPQTGPFRSILSFSSPDCREQKVPVICHETGI